MDIIATNGSDPPQPCCVDGGEYRRSFLLRWFLILCFSLLIAALAGAATWLLQPDTYTAMALVRVKASSGWLVFEAVPPSEREFEIYKNTLQQTLQNRFVLEAAVRQVMLAMKESKTGDDVTEVRMLGEEVDPAGWLAENLQTDYPGEAEYLRIRLTRDNPEEAAILVNAVVDAFLEEVVGAESSRKRTRLKELDDSYFAWKEKQRELNTKLRSLTEYMGSTPSPADIVNQSIVIERLRILHSRQFNTQYKLRNAQRKIRHSHDLLAWTIGLQVLGQPASRVTFLTHQTMVTNVDKSAISEAKLDAYAESDRSASQFALQQDQLHALIRQTLSLGNEINPMTAERLKGYRAELSAVTQRLDERRAELKQELSRQRQTDSEAETTKLQARIAQFGEQLEELETDIEKQEKRIGRDVFVSLDAEMMQTEIKQLEPVVAAIASERIELQVELEKHQSRITLMQRAVAPKSPDERAWYPGPALAAAIAFFVAAGAMITFGSLRRARRRRLTAGE